MELRHEIEQRKQIETQLLISQDEIKTHLRNVQFARQTSEEQAIKLIELAEDTALLNKNLTEEINIRKAVEEKLKFLAQHDALTGLPNRRLFEDLSDQSIKLAKRHKTTDAILFIDIDGFKGINDTLGHGAGDELLVKISEQLAKSIRNSDSVARIGGDEFLVYLVDINDVTNAQNMAKKIINALSTPFVLKDGLANIGASIGISTYPNDADNIATLIQCADKAMYAAKESGKNTYRNWEKDPDD